MMDIKMAVDSWIINARLQSQKEDGPKSKHHFSITYSLYNSVIKSFGKRAQCMKHHYKITTINGIIPNIKEYAGPASEAASLKITFLHDSNYYCHVEPSVCTSELIYEFEKL